LGPRAEKHLDHVGEGTARNCELRDYYNVGAVGLSEQRDPRHVINDKDLLDSVRENLWPTDVSDVGHCMTSFEKEQAGRSIPTGGEGMNEYNPPAHEAITHLDSPESLSADLPFPRRSRFQSVRNIAAMGFLFFALVYFYFVIALAGVVGAFVLLFF
jgi:hypothetical protein